MKVKTVVTTLLILLMLAGIVMPLATRAAVVSSDYSPVTGAYGVLEADRADFLSADGNLLGEDIANAVFQGPGFFAPSAPDDDDNGVPDYFIDWSIGYMSDMDIAVTGLGTLGNMSYKSWKLENTPQMSSRAGFPNELLSGWPLEGWAVYYNASIIDPQGVSLDHPSGIVVATYTALLSGSMQTDSTYQESYFYIDEDNIASEVLVDNPRLFVMKFTIPLHADLNADNPETPVNETMYLDFELHIVVVFNKATKFVEIFHKLEMTATLCPHDWIVNIDYGLAREVVLDANPQSDRAFYGWKNITLPTNRVDERDFENQQEDFFMVLSWVNESIAPFVVPQDYYAVYALGYPIPNSYTISSMIYNYDDNVMIWKYNPLTSNTYQKYVALDMTLGDQALIRMDWWKSTGPITIGITGCLIHEDEMGWILTMYGIYDVDGHAYDGGEGGVFERGELILSNGTDYKAPVTSWSHTGTLGFLNGLVTKDELMSSEGQLVKYVSLLDLDQDGNVWAAEDLDGDGVGSGDEADIPFYWWPTEELLWQLYFKFVTPSFKKLPPACDCFYSTHYGGEEFQPFPYFNKIGHADFMAVPASGATTDAAGSSELNARFVAHITVFDIEIYGMEVFPGALSAGGASYLNQKVPYLVLRLTAINMSTLPETNAERLQHYIASDGRILLQMEWEDVSWTPWRDSHYFVISAAGPGPNLVTRYFNDFSPITFTTTGGPRIVLTIYGEVLKDLTQYSSNEGFGVIAVVKDHFNNTGLLVWGVTAQDTYWTSYVAARYLDSLTYRYPDARAFAITIDYTNSGVYPAHEFGNGKGIPIAHPAPIDTRIVAVANDFTADISTSPLATVP